jgi:hypothetical protein
MARSSSRFQFLGDYSFRTYNGDGSLRAFMDVTDTELGIVFRDMKLFEKDGEFYVRSAAREYEKNGETKYSDYIGKVWDQNEDAWDANGVQYFEEMAQAAAKKLAETDGGESRPKRGGGGGERRGASGGGRSGGNGGGRNGGRSSGRGPVGGAKSGGRGEPPRVGAGSRRDIDDFPDYNTAGGDDEEF